jgi:thiosulfate/3-mercaptopyruvate sulfurtransferase
MPPSRSYDPIVSVDALYALPALVLLDARSGPSARAAYAAGHLEGAHFVDLETDLSLPSRDAARGGRHPLPDLPSFAITLSHFGITPLSSVVIYDDQGGANAAARAWWMLRAVGHTQTYVLDGGLGAALAQGRALSTRIPETQEVPPYPTRAFHAPQASLEEVDMIRRDPRFRVLDVRSAERYRGEHEPIDPVAGHIPGALNLPLSENLNADGRFRTREELRARYMQLLGDVPAERLVVHCGSGVTACHTLLSLERAGLHGAALYVGSWSEWCRNTDKPHAP